MNIESMDPVALMELGVETLLLMKTQIEQELVFFQNALANLKVAETKLQESVESVQRLQPQDEGRKLLVPLTSSVYVEGEMTDPDNFLVDIGGGYFVVMSSKGAEEFFKRKLSIVKVEENKLRSIGLEKSKTRIAITEVLQLKLEKLSSSTN